MFFVAVPHAVQEHIIYIRSDYGGASFRDFPVH